MFADTNYDALCCRLLAVFDTFDHPHKHLTNKERLAEGSGYHIREEDYPPQVRHGFAVYVRSLNSGQMEYDLHRCHQIGKAALFEEVIQRRHLT